jgi:hypothetical protein
MLLPWHLMAFISFHFCYDIATSVAPMHLYENEGGEPIKVCMPKGGFWRMIEIVVAIHDFIVSKRVVEVGRFLPSIVSSGSEGFEAWLAEA